MNTFSYLNFKIETLIELNNIPSNDFEPVDLGRTFNLIDIIFRRMLITHARVMLLS